MMMYAYVLLYFECCFFGDYFGLYNVFCDGSNDVFFFFKQKTAYEMRISDWSSDVCSSDLQLPRGLREKTMSWPWRSLRNQSLQRVILPTFGSAVLATSIVSAIRPAVFSGGKGDSRAMAMTSLSQDLRAICCETKPSQNAER